MSETRDLSYYSSLPYAVRVYREPDGSGFTAEIPDLPGCITGADTLDEVWALIDDAKRGWLELALAETVGARQAQTRAQA